MRWLLVLALILIAAAGVWLVPQNRNDREQWEGGGMVSGSTSRTPHHDSNASPQAVGTSGAHNGSAESHGGDVITDVETITGANDGMALVGRRVDLHVDVQARANDRAFWVGPRDNRLLVVLSRDTRDGLERQTGQPSNHGIAPVRGGQRAAISGVIRPLPKAEHRYSWSLSREEHEELEARKVYIAADTVTSEGHGTY